MPTGPSRRRPTGEDRARYIAVVAVAAAILATVVVGGSLNYLSRSVTVDLVVDGTSETITTRAGTVADLLAQQKLTVTADDLVVPAAGSDLAEGTRVELRYARQLTVVTDGAHSIHVTNELTVGAALASLGTSVEGAAISLSLDQVLSRSGAVVEIITPKQVTIDDGGRTDTVNSVAETVADVLAERQLVLSETDVVIPSIDTMVVEGMAIAITRIRVEEQVRREVVPHDTTETNDPDLSIGARRVVTDGVDGENEVTYAVTYVNGQVTAEEPLATSTIREPVAETVRVGTKAAPAVDPGVSAGGPAADLNWAALADCESSGNPRAVNPAGYYGLYQFSLPTWRSVGGTGNPVDASPEEQTMRAQMLYNKAGAGQWPHCGPRLFT